MGIANKGSFTEGQELKKGQGKRGKGQRTKVLEALQRAGKREEDVYDLLTKKATNRRAKDHGIAFKEVLDRLCPKPKSSYQEVEFEFPKDGTLVQQAQAVLAAIASGTIAPDIGAQILSGIKSLITIEEVTELRGRLEELEALINGEG